MSSYSNWYQHDFDAGNDPKIMQLEMDYGLEGYGLYHRILEHMGTADNHALTEKEINYIAKKCFSKIDNCCKIFLELNLFSEQKDGKIISKSLIKRLRELDEKHKKRVIAGSKGGKKKASNAKAKLQANYKQKSSNALPLDKTILSKNILDNTKKKETPKPSEKAYQLSTYLFDKMLDNNPSAKKPNFDTWGKHVDLMLNRDERTEEQIRYLIDFSQNDLFWQQNILSTAKLRKQFDALVLKVKAESKPQEKKYLTQAEKNQIALDKMQKEIDDEKRLNNERSYDQDESVIYGELE
jgi:hypothetical protein